MGKNKLISKKEVGAFKRQLNRFIGILQDAEDKGTRLNFNQSDLCGIFMEAEAIITQLNRPRRDYS